ncbi:hypothetical protein ASG80_09350 [Agromyces sp. Soil535]|nr:hypothetical protein ASG80_09350 [Agromyces sp. Soil535]
MTLTPQGRTELTLSGGGCSCCATPVTSSVADRADAAASGASSVATTVEIAAAVAEAGYRVVAR